MEVIPGDFRCFTFPYLVSHESCSSVPATSPSAYCIILVQFQRGQDLLGATRPLGPEKYRQVEAESSQVGCAAQGSSAAVPIIALPHETHKLLLCGSSSLRKRALARSALSLFCEPLRSDHLAGHCGIPS